jgi:hypothetical protein
MRIQTTWLDATYTMDVHDLISVGSLSNIRSFLTTKCAKLSQVGTMNFSIKMINYSFTVPWRCLDEGQQQFPAKYTKSYSSSALTVAIDQFLLLYCLKSEHTDKPAYVVLELYIICTDTPQWV